MALFYIRPAGSPDDEAATKGCVHTGWQEGGGEIAFSMKLVLNRIERTMMKKILSFLGFLLFTAASGSILNAKITLIPGSTLIVRDGGTISMASGYQFEAPIGVTVIVEDGKIQ